MKYILLTLLMSFSFLTMHCMEACVHVNRSTGDYTVDKSGSVKQPCKEITKQREKNKR